MAESISSVAVMVCWLLDLKLAMIRSERLNRSGDS